MPNSILDYTKGIIFYYFTMNKHVDSLDATNLLIL